MIIAGVRISRHIASFASSVYVVYTLANDIADQTHMIHYRPITYTARLSGGFRKHAFRKYTAVFTLEESSMQLPNRCS